MEDHVVKMLTNRIARYGSKEVIRFREKEKSALSWNDLGEQVRQVMVALQSLGCGEGENVGIFSPNRAEWLIADLGIMANRCVTVPMYATSSPEQLRYIIQEAEIRVLFVGSRDQLDKIKDLPKEVDALEMLVVFDEGDTSSDHMMGFSHFLDLSREKEERLKDKWNHYRPDDIATIIYSSGTTGEPKGVVLKHSHFAHTFRAHDKRLDIHEDDVSLSFLPLSHVFERLWTHYMLHCGVVNVFLDNPREVMSALTTVKPTLMCTVPRFFDKTYQGIRDEVGSWPVIKQKIFHWAMRSGLKANVYHSCSKKIPWFLKQQLTVADALVHKRLRNVFGGNIRLMPCAGAALNTDILKFFHAMGLFIVYGYGLTETTATVSCFRADHFKYGTCGDVMPDVEVKQ